MQLNKCEGKMEWSNKISDMFFFEKLRKNLILDSDNFYMNIYELLAHDDFWDTRTPGHQSFAIGKGNIKQIVFECPACMKYYMVKLKIEENM